MKLNQILTLIRENNYKTQQEVADILGISRSTYSEYETGATTPPIDKLCLFAIAFNISLDYLLGLAKNKNPYGKMLSFNQNILIKNLISLRTENGFTQEKLAEKVACASPTISSYENGYSKVPYDIIIKLSKLYKVPTDYIVGIVKNNENSTK